MFKEINNLRIFFEEPEKEFHLRGIARILKNSAFRKELMRAETREELYQTIIQSDGEP